MFYKKLFHRVLKIAILASCYSDFNFIIFLKKSKILLISLCTFRPFAFGARAEELVALLFASYHYNSLFVFFLQHYILWYKLFLNTIYCGIYKNIIILCNNIFFAVDKLCKTSQILIFE